MTGAQAQTPRAAARSRLVRVGIAAAATLLTLVAAEAASRLLDPHREVFPPSIWEGRPAGIEEFDYVTDPELGYRPVLGNRGYSAHGTLINEHRLEKTPDVTRLLFLGDSVARKARLQRALSRGCADEPIEIWTAAVEGYNTAQEVAYFLRYARAVRPDHVTLLFHNNDFLATPVVFEDAQEGLTLSIGEASLSRLDRWLLATSNLYRHFFKRRLRSLTRRDPVTTAADTRAAIQRLARALDQDGAGLTVVLLPILAPFDQWTAREKRHRDLGLAILEELEVDAYDLLPALDSAVAAGARLGETPGDTWHPSRQTARRFVRYLLRRGYLGFAVDEERCRV